MRIAGKSRLGVVANHRSISHRDALTFKAAVSSNSQGLTMVTHLKDLAVFCTAYMKHVGEVWGRMVDRLRERAVSATPMRKCSPPSCHVPRYSGRRLRIDHPLMGWFRRGVPSFVFRVKAPPQQPKFAPWEVTHHNKGSLIVLCGTVHTLSSSIGLKLDLSFWHKFLRWL